MRLSFALVAVMLPSVAFAQTKEIDDAIKRKLATAKWVLAQEAPTGGFYLAPQDPKIDAPPKPGLRATSGAVRALKYLGQEIPNKEKHAAFVLTCLDPKTGAFAEPGGKPDVTITSVGVMAAAELGIPKEKYAKALDYLKENAKTFEEVRIGAAGVEAWGVKDCPFDLKPWLKVVDDYGNAEAGDAKDGGARETGSLAAAWLRLGQKLPDGNDVRGILNSGQRADGAWSKKGEKTSDIETTYRVLRAYVLMKEKPAEMKKLREFVDSHRNADGGWATKPGDKSTMSGAYYATIISKWLDEMDARK